jgi:molecular chaperone HscB
VRRGSLHQLQERLDAKDWVGAAALVRALMFVRRFIHDVERKLDALQG